MGTWLVRGIAIVCMLVALAACEEKQEDYKTLFSDDFNRANGDLGSDWSTDIPTGSSMQIVGQQVEASGANGTPAALYTALIDKKTDQRASVDAIISGADYSSADSPFGIVIRNTDSSTLDTGGYLYLCSVLDGLLRIIVPDANGDAVALESGTETVSMSDGDTYRFVFTAEGDKLDCEIISGDSVLDEITVKDDTSLEGYVGLVGGDLGTSLHWDDFLLETRDH